MRTGLKIASARLLQILSMFVPIKGNFSGGFDGQEGEACQGAAA
jgi:hypothetical protein